MAKNGYPEVEEQEGTRLEKFLLFILVAFLLMGGFWVFDRIQEVIPQPVLRGEYEGTSMPWARGQFGTPVEDELGVSPLRKQAAKKQEVVTHLNDAFVNAEATQTKAELEYKFQREEFRTAIESGSAKGKNASKFESARSKFQALQTLTAKAEAALKLAQGDLDSEQRTIDLRAKAAQKVFDDRTKSRTVKLFVLNFLFALICLGLSWFGWVRGRKQRWRYQSILTAAFIASILQLFALSFRYMWEIILADFAVLGVSVIGSVVSILAIVGIKRWLFSPVRVAQARLANRRCPICATSFVDSQSHCWQCGNALVEKCAACGENRLIFAPYCGSCGNAGKVD